MFLNQNGNDDKNVSCFNKRRWSCYNMISSFLPLIFISFLSLMVAKCLWMECISKICMFLIIVYMVSVYFCISILYENSICFVYIISYISFLSLFDSPMIVTKMRSPKITVSKVIMMNSSSSFESGFKSKSFGMLELVALYMNVSFK